MHLNSFIYLVVVPVIFIDKSSTSKKPTSCDKTLTPSNTYPSSKGKTGANVASASNNKNATGPTDCRHDMGDDEAVLPPGDCIIEYLRTVTENYKSMCDFRTPNLLKRCALLTRWVYPHDASLMSAFNPRHSQLPDVYLHFPDDFGDCSMTCPHCASKNITREQYYFKWVTDIDRRFVIMSRSYKCKDCYKCSSESSQSYIFSGCDPRVLKQMPLSVQHSFPASVTNKGSAFSIPLVKLLIANTAGGSDPSAFRKIIYEMHTGEFERKKFVFYAKANELRVNGSIETMPDSGYGSFNDKDGYNGHVPSNQVFRRLFSEVMSQRVPYYHRRMQLNCPGPTKTMCGDATFKVASLIRVAAAGHPYTCMYTLVAGDGVVLGYYLLCNESRDEMMPVLKKMAGRFRSLGVTELTIYTDDCCKEINMWKEGFGEFITIREEVGVSQDESLPVSGSGSSSAGKTLSSSTRLPILPIFTYSSIMYQKIVLVKSVNTAELICELFLVEAAKQTAAGEQLFVVGFDIEWTVPFYLTPTEKNMNMYNKPATLQLAARGIGCFVFHLSAMLLWKKLPTKLKKILEATNITKVGKNISADAKYIKRFFDVDMGGILDVAHIARDINLCQATTSLQNLTATCLKMHLPKDENIRGSIWHLPTLSPQQVEYAGSDAIASCEVAWKLLAAQKMLKVEPTPGLHVNLYDSSITKRVATAIIVHPSVPQVYITPKNMVLLQIVKVDIPGSLVFKHPGYSADDPPSLGLLLDRCGVNTLVVPWPKKFVKRQIAFIEDARNADAFTTKHASTAEKASPSSTSAVFTSDVFLKDLEKSAGNFNLRIRLDAFHSLQRLSKVLKKTHGCFAIFMSRIRDAMFIIDIESRENLFELLRKRGVTEADIADLQKFNYSYIVRRCQRMIPLSALLEERIMEVVSELANVKDAKTHEPLFRPIAWKELKSLLVHIRKGCLSDVPDNRLYYWIRTGENSYTLKCGRGSKEGLHYHVRKALTMFHGSPKYVHLFICEFMYRWNLRALSKSRSQQLYGHFDLSLMEDIQDLASKFGINEYSNLIRTRNFKDTEETFGILKRDVNSEDVDIDDADAIDDADETANGEKLNDLFDESVNADEDEDVTNPELSEEAAFNRDISNSAKFVVGDFVKYVGKNGPPLNSTRAVVTVVKSRMSQGIWICEVYTLQFDKGGVILPNVLFDEMELADIETVGVFPKFNLYQTVLYTTINPDSQESLFLHARCQVTAISPVNNDENVCIAIEYTVHIHGTSSVVSNISEACLTTYVANELEYRKPSQSEIELAKMQNTPCFGILSPHAISSDPNVHMLYEYLLPKCIVSGKLSYDVMVNAWNALLVEYQDSKKIPNGAPACVSRIKTCISTATLKLLQKRMQDSQNRTATLAPYLHADSILKCHLRNTDIEMPPQIYTENLSQPSSSSDGSTGRNISIPATSVSSCIQPGSVTTDLRVDQPGTLFLFLLSCIHVVFISPFFKFILL